MNVLFIEWQLIPRETHLDILKNIPIGEYIDSLPHYTDDSLSWKIPIPAPAPVVIALEDARPIIDTGYIEFRKHRVIQCGNKYPHPVVREMYAWERVI